MPRRLEVGPTEDGAFMIGPPEDGVMRTLSSQDVAERALALAKDHRQLCFLGVDAYIHRDIGCADLTTRWTMFRRK